MALADRLPALGHRHFRNWTLGSFVSNLGGQLQTWGMFWHLDAMTHQPLAVGYVGLVRVVPLLILGLFGGVVADQRDRRKILLTTQTGMASTAVAMAALTLTGHITPAIVYALIAFEAIFRAYNGPVRQSMIANLVPTELLPNALGINGIQWRLSEVLGPAFSGLLIWGLGPHLGLTACYVLNGFSFLAMIAAVIKLPAMPPKVVRSRGAREVVASIAEGFAFLKASPVIANAMWIDFWGTFLAGAQALLPAFVRAELGLGPMWYGIMAAAGGVGAMFASAALTWLPPIRRQGIWVIGMIASFGAFTLVFGLTRNFWLAAFCYAGIGASDMISTVLRQTIRQLAIPDQMRGRLSSIGMIFQISGPQLGDYEAAGVAQVAGVRASLILGGIGAFAVAGWYRFNGKLRDHEHKA
ncbi:MFS transporter [Fimbriimonas ginsengisoli]|uniref:Major facilitator superfamily MFS_1 n=1 Tax=Fimbriimonas ginsengisoli Gsoil 348 TaxID=661478 RepID=A0A068NPJ1_FIMGI|nr:MFS transporter [Fimbriimonas ginsengisoli]AIE85366.1 major facilitator superfamily MFS_1 [Fimbriimonas ginsengisoli Gsoil 348]